jgi:hypothetical protein
MNASVSIIPDALPIPTAIVRVASPAEGIFAEPDGERMLRATLHPTGCTFPPSSILALRLAAKRKPPQPAHTLFGDVE